VTRRTQGVRIRTACADRRCDPSQGVALLTSALLFVLVALILLVAPPATAAQDAASLASALADKHDAGVTRALAAAQACYREALAQEAAGNTAEALRLLEAASAFDPEFPDPHFTAARLAMFRAPDQAVAEMSEAFRILARSYPWQRHLLANTATGLVFVWIVGLLLAVVGIVLRHLPHLLHVMQEVLGRRSTVAVRGAAAAVTLSPLLWGLGVVPTTAVYAGLVSFRLSKRELTLVLLLLLSTMGLAAGVGLIAPWAGAPTLEGPSMLVNRAMSTGYDPDLAGALLAWESVDPQEALYPFALGTIARRSGDLDLAERQLTQAAVLAPRSSWILTNLGNVYFAREDYAHARSTYEAAAAADPATVEPHFNLAQVYTKQLMFTEASREQSRASAIAFDRVRDFSRWSAPQLNRTVMDASPPEPKLWGLAKDRAAMRGPTALSGNPFLVAVTKLSPPAPFGLVFVPGLFLIFTLVGQLLGRNLATLHCSNCQKIICRRCVKRMQQRAFCESCHRSVKDLKSSEFTRLLLTRQGRSAARRRTLWQAILTFILPGGGQILRGASLSGFAAILVMTAAATLVISNGALVPSLDVLPLGGPGLTKRIPLILLFLVTYAATVARYFATTTTRAPDFVAFPERGPSRAPRLRDREIRRS
jgi:tetratricopeptide (TPR) repeat protein